MTMTSRTTFLAALSALVALTVAACGGNAASTATVATSAAPTAAPSQDMRAAFTAYRDCMAKNGVALPEPGAQGARPSQPGAMPLPDGVDQATFDKAQQACADLRPQFGGPGRGQPDATAFAAFRSCLADHEVTLGDTPDAMRQLDRTDPKVASALKTCSALLPPPGSAASAVPSPS